MSENLKTVLKQIFLYHKLENEIELKQVWMDDLKFYSEKEVKSAWDKFRQDPNNEFKKPKSWDLVKIIKSARTQNFRPENKKDILESGVSLTQDRLKSHLDCIYQNMPQVLEFIRGADSPGEKLSICAAALGNPKLMDEPVMKMIVKKMSVPENGN